MQEAHAATIERVTQLNPPRIEALEVMATMTPAPLEEEVSFALLSANDLLGGPDELFMASAMDALPPYIDYADESGKPLRAALITMALAGAQRAEAQASHRRPLRLPKPHHFGEEGQFGFLVREAGFAEQRDQVFLLIRAEERLVEPDWEVFQHPVQVGGVAGLD